MSVYIDLVSSYLLCQVQTILFLHRRHHLHTRHPIPQALSDTHTSSTMHLLKIVALIAPAVYACSDNGYRCKNDDVDADTSFQTTESYCDKSGGELCYCSRADEDYCDLLAQDVEYFQTKCEDYGSGWYSDKC